MRLLCALLLVTGAQHALCQEPQYVFFPGEESWHQTGYQVGNGWAASVENKTEAYLTYGPYWTPSVPGDYRVVWTLFVDNNSADDLNILDLDVNDATSNSILTTLTVTREMFQTPFGPQNFTAYFKLSAGSPLPQLEFRVYYHCCVYAAHLMTTVQGPLVGGSFEAFWNDQAHWKFIAAHQFPTSPGGEYGMNVGFQFVTMLDGTWYLFHREYAWQPQPSYCKADYARIVVRNSTDQGVTWSDKVVIVSPVPNTPTECANVDGSGYYDGENNMWHYIGQCLDRTEVWNMCHFTRAGSDPMGAFTPDPHNPVVRSGQLWSQICAGTGKHCPTDMGSEGTPEIVLKDEFGYYFVTFHGWNGQVSARGVAKSLDFVNWIVDDGLTSLPADAIFTSLDCNRWNISWAQGGCVGGGEGTILRSGSYLYMLIEAPDITLGCLTTPGQQNWPLGLLRSPTFSFPTGQWEQFSVEPTVIPIIKEGCYIQYHRLFVDAATGMVYLEYWADSWMQLFQLVPGAGQLPIVAGPPPS